MDSVIVVCITNNLSLDYLQWQMVCVPSLGTCNVHCHIRRRIHIHGCDSTVCFCISSLSAHHQPRWSTSLLTSSRMPRSRRLPPLPSLPPVLARSPPRPRPGPCLCRRR